jgi:membrane-associated phospholipid phosphatase
MSAANWVYIWGYFPFLIGAAVFIWLRSRDRYVVLRNAVLLSGVVGLVVFALFPTAPPRLAGSGFVDTILEGSRSYRLIQPPELANQYAAMPSLHVGWSLLVGITLASVVRRPVLRALALALPAAMAFAVVATANHYVLDVMAGVLLVLAALWVSATWLSRLSTPAATLDRRAVDRPLPVRRRPPSGQRSRAHRIGGRARLGAGRG